MEIFKILMALPLALCACSAGLPPADMPPADTSSSPGAVRLTWMGTAGCRITDGQTSFYIDPFVSRYGLLKVGLGFSLAPRMEAVAEWCEKTGGNIRTDAVIVSHSHYDHAMDAPFFAEKTGAVLIGSESTAWIGRGAGLEEERIRVVRGGESIRIGRFQVRFLESRHGKALFGKIPWPGEIREPLVPPAAASSYRLGKTFTLVITHPEGTLVHNGSAGYIPGMFGQIKADVVLLGIAGREDTRALFDNVVVPLQAETVIPIHHDHFFSPLDRPVKHLWGVDLEEFKRTADGYAERFSTQWISIGTPVEIFTRN